jgi:hypothetical protein
MNFCNESHNKAFQDSRYKDILHTFSSASSGIVASGMETHHVVEVVVFA